MLTSAITIALAATLAGCAPEPTARPTAVAASETASPTSSPKPESATPAGAKTGDVVDAKTASAINGDYIDPMRKNLAVQLSTGEWILVKAAEPLPEVVIESFTNDVKMAAPNYATDTTSNEGDFALRDVQDALEVETGRRVASVVIGMTYDDARGSYYQSWAVGEPASDVSGLYPSKEAAVEAVEGWVAVSPAMRGYLIIDTRS